MTEQVLPITVVFTLGANEQIGTKRGLDARAPQRKGPGSAIAPRDRLSMQGGVLKDSISQPIGNGAKERADALSDARQIRKDIGV